MADVMINDTKVRRAQKVLALITGEQNPRDNNESLRADRFSKHLQKAKIDPKDTDKAVKFLYELFGGLVVSEVEAKKIETRKKEAKKKGKMIE